MRSGRPMLGDGSAGSGNRHNNNKNNAGGGNGGENDSFVSRISEYFMRWKVRPDVVLRGRHENKSKGALSAFWQARINIRQQQQHPTRKLIAYVMSKFEN